MYQAFRSTRKLALRWIACMCEGFVEVLSSMLTTGTRFQPGTRVPGPKNPAGFGSDPEPVTGSTHPGKAAVIFGPGSTRMGSAPVNSTQKYKSVILGRSLVGLFAIFTRSVH